MLVLFLSTPPLLFSMDRHQHKQPYNDKNPPHTFSLRCTSIRYEHDSPSRPPSTALLRCFHPQQLTLPAFINLPVDILYEIFTYLHPQDILRLSRSTRRLRQLLMTREARFVWKSALANVEGFPFCPPDLTEPQFANLAFDEHCHFCSAPRVKQVLWSCRARCCKNCFTEWFLSENQVKSVISHKLTSFKLETIFPCTTTCLRTGRKKSRETVFYKPIVDVYMRELEKFNESEHESLERWSKEKQTLQNARLSHAALCEHWETYWTFPNESQDYDFLFTLSLLGLLVFLWKDKLFN